MQRAGRKRLTEASGLIVSGDKDLLVLQQFNGIPTLSPAQAAALLGATGKTCRRRRTSVASSIVFRPGAWAAQLSWPR